MTYSSLYELDFFIQENVLTKYSDVIQSMTSEYFENKLHEELYEISKFVGVPGLFKVDVLFQCNEYFLKTDVNINRLINSIIEMDGPEYLRYMRFLDKKIKYYQSKAFTINPELVTIVDDVLNNKKYQSAISFFETVASVFTSIYNDMLRKALRHLKYGEIKAFSSCVDLNIEVNDTSHDLSFANMDYTNYNFRKE